MNNDEMAEVSSATSRCTGRRMPTPQRIHVVTGGPERRDITGDAGDSDIDMNTDQQREVATHRQEVSANRNIVPNQHIIALKNPADGTMEAAVSCKHARLA